MTLSRANAIYSIVSELNCFDMLKGIHYESREILKGQFRFEITDTNEESFFTSEQVSKVLAITNLLGGTPIFGSDPETGHAQIWIY